METAFFAVFYPCFKTAQKKKKEKSIVALFYLDNILIN